MTADDFMKARLAGDCPESVTVWLGDDSPRECDVAVPVGQVKRADVRAFAGLPVFVHAQSYTPALLTLVDRIKLVSSFILVAVLDFGNDLGWLVIDKETVEL